jgi:hypothetical protein
MPKTRVEWVVYAGPRGYGTVSYVSACGNLVAVDAGGYNGFQVYRTYWASLPATKRTLSRAVSVGGLPKFVEGAM